MAAEGRAKITWLPYELHPEVPAEGMAREDYFPPEYLNRIEAAPWRAMAEAEGLVMKPAGRLINTRLALAAAEFARERGRFDEVHHALFKAFWEQSGDIATVDGLKAIGSACGLDGEALGAALEDGRYEPLLDANRSEATQLGINGIPAHVFGMRYLVMGAQPYEVLSGVIDKLS